VYDFAPKVINSRILFWVIVRCCQHLCFTASNGRMINEFERLYGIGEILPWKLPGRTEETQATCKDNRLGRDSNRAGPEYKSERSHYASVFCQILFHVFIFMEEINYVFLFRTLAF
jgi:hypothetical protein